MVSFVFAPLAMAFGLLAVLGIVLTLYVIYDVLSQQPRMLPLEKLVWIIVVISFNILGVIAYFVLVKREGRYLLENGLFSVEDRRIQDLERLQELRDEGALTAEEFEREKQRLLDADGGH